MQYINLYDKIEQRFGGDDLERIIFHVDVNNAFLSWTACDMLKKGANIDIREIPSIIGGDEKQRKGIVLAKSEVAKKYGIKTAETIYQAKQKCNNLKMFPPDFRIYSYYSNRMYEILSDYSDKIERYSIDECFLDYTSMQQLFGEPISCAKVIQRRIFDELGFTVNIGIGNNKLLAKMASDLQKPNKIITIWKSEIENKMWKLPVQDLFMVGRKSIPKLNNLNIYTIGDLARYNKKLLIKVFGKMGQQMHNYANGIDDSIVNGDRHEYKGIGNSITTSVNISDINIANNIILSICEYVCKRLRDEGMYTKCINVHIKNANFIVTSHQRKIQVSTNVTDKIYDIAKQLLEEIWTGEPIRSFGVRLDELTKYSDSQINLFEDIEKNDKKSKLDMVIDRTRNKYGSGSIKRAVFIDNNIPHMLPKEDK